MTQGNNLLLTITGKDLSSETILFWFLILHFILVGYYGSGTVMSYAIMHLSVVPISTTLHPSLFT